MLCDASYPWIDIPLYVTDQHSCVFRSCEPASNIPSLIAVVASTTWNKSQGLRYSGRLQATVRYERYDSVLPGDTDSKCESYDRFDPQPFLAGLC